MSETKNKSGSTNMVEITKTVTTVPKITEMFAELELHGIIPNTGLTHVLSHTGHTYCSAVNDLLDNSMDAGAKWMGIYLIRSVGVNKSQVIIADNGKGMSVRKLVESLTCGVENTDAKLGKFGVGIKASALTIGTSFEVLTKTNGGPLVKGVFDPDFIRKNGWFAPVGETLDPNDMFTFVEYIQKQESSFEEISGTLVICKDVNGFLSEVTENHDRYEEVAQEIKQSVAETFRGYLDPFINDELNAYYVKNKIPLPVNNNPEKITIQLTRNGKTENIMGVDPLERQSPNTEIVLDKELLVSNPYDPKTKIKVKVTVVKLALDDTYHTHNPDHIHQGVYFVRSGRQISGANGNDMFRKIVGAKHSSVNHVRSEVCVDKDADGIFVLNHDKCDLKYIHPSVMKSLENEIYPVYSDLRNQRKEQSDKNRLASDVAPKKLKEFNIGLNRLTDVYEYPSVSINKTIDEKTNVEKCTFKGVNFVKKSLGEMGNIFDPCVSSTGEVVVNLNVDHPFNINHLKFGSITPFHRFISSSVLAWIKLEQTDPKMKEKRFKYMTDLSQMLRLMAKNEI